MARPEKEIPTTLEEAVAQLRRDPGHAVHAQVEGLEVELRVVDGGVSTDGNDVLGGATWEGESAEELLRILKEGRRTDAAAEALL